MQGKIPSRINGGNSSYGRIASDYYATPPEATIALLDALSLPIGTCVLEPACGEGHIAEALINRGLRVIASDLEDRGYGTYPVDFLASDLFSDFDWIITNPPFSKAEAFIRKALEIGKPFAYLLKSQYWHAAKRTELFETNGPTEIYALNWRPDFLFGQRGCGSPLMDVTWCVWRHDAGDTKYRVLRKPEAKEG